MELLQEEATQTENAETHELWGTEVAVSDAAPPVDHSDQAETSSTMEADEPGRATPAEFVDRLIASCHEEYDDAPTFTEDHLRDALVSAISLIEGREPSAEDFVIARPMMMDFVDERLHGSTQPRVLPCPVPETPADQKGGAA